VTDGVLVTGGAGYLGIPVVEELLHAGRDVRVLDVLLHDQRELAAELRRSGVDVVQGDVRDGVTRRAALDGIRHVVHLAAIVGDPACARAPAQAREVNVTAAYALVADAAESSVERCVFASTCSNYGRMADPTVPVTEAGVLAPVSLYAEQKVALEGAVLGRDRVGMAATCLRFDLTVNEFTRDLWADRELEVFGEQFWRPYVHVRDAARAVRIMLEAPRELVAHEVFNVGDTGENYRKLDIVELIRRKLETGRVSFVHRDEDPRDYKVSFEKIRRVLGFEVTQRVPDGISQVVDALDSHAFDDPFDGRYRNVK
jgi:nucleoside-diphosphate-sugar epimerase